MGCLELRSSELRAFQAPSFGFGLLDALNESLFDVGLSGFSVFGLLELGIY